MCPVHDLDHTLQMLGKHSAVSDAQLSEYRSSRRHAWLKTVLAEVRERKIDNWSRATVHPGDGLSMGKWFELDWASVWMQASRAGWRTERGAKRTELHYIPPVRLKIIKMIRKCVKRLFSVVLLSTGYDAARGR